MAGAKVACARNGREAVDRFLAPEGRTFDAVLMDIQMPKLNGYEATKLIRDSGCCNARSIPIIAMTANAFREDIEAALEAGMNDHIAKPVDVTVLYHTLEKTLSGSL